MYYRLSMPQTSSLSSRQTHPVFVVVMKGYYRYYIFQSTYIYVIFCISLSLSLALSFSSPIHVLLDFLFFIKFLLSFIFVTGVKRYRSIPVSFHLSFPPTFSLSFHLSTLNCPSFSLSLTSPVSHVMFLPHLSLSPLSLNTTSGRLFKLSLTDFPDTVRLFLFRDCSLVKYDASPQLSFKCCCFFLSFIQPLLPFFL